MLALSVEIAVALHNYRGSQLAILDSLEADQHCQLFCKSSTLHLDANLCCLVQLLPGIDNMLCTRIAAGANAMV